MEKILKIEIDKNLNGRTIRHILRHHLDLSVRLIRLLKYTSGGILLNGEGAKLDAPVATGDILRLTMVDNPSENIEPADLPLRILYEDEDIIALDKPRAMPTHPSQNHHTDTLANALAYYFRDRNFTFRVITRLDKDTSGVVLVAKNAMAAQRLSMAMQDGGIEKEYIAAVHGIPNPERGVVDAPIKRAEVSLILRCVAPDGKAACTEYETEKTKDGISLVRLFPKTGRTHQIRVHMQHIGTPIYGDDLYGAPQVGERTRLHCHRITLVHPMQKTRMQITAPVPSDILTFFKRF